MVVVRGPCGDDGHPRGGWDAAGGVPSVTVATPRFPFVNLVVVNATLMAGLG